MTFHFLGSGNAHDGVVCLDILKVEVEGIDNVAITVIFATFPSGGILMFSLSPNPRNALNL